MNSMLIVSPESTTILVNYCQNVEKCGEMWRKTPIPDLFSRSKMWKTQEKMWKTFEFSTKKTFFLVIYAMISKKEA